MNPLIDLTQTRLAKFQRPRFCAPLMHSKLNIGFTRALIMSAVGCSLVVLAGCNQSDSTLGSETQAVHADSSNSAEKPDESLWRYQNTRFGDPKGEAEPQSRATDDQLIAPIPRRSAHSQALLEAVQINAGAPTRAVTLAIKTDPTHGRYLTLTDPAASFACQPSCELRARFDQGQSQIFRFESSGPHLLYLLKDTQANRLVDQIKTAQSLQLSIPIEAQNPDRIRYTFEVQGLDLGKIAL